MNQTELIAQTADELRIPKTNAQRLLRATLQEIRDLLVDGEAVSIPRWGTFDTLTHEARRGFLPRGFSSQGQGYAIFPKRRVPVFRTGKALHEGVHDLDDPEEQVSG